jgi:hypothetical protein
MFNQYSLLGTIKHAEFKFDIFFEWPVLKQKREKVIIWLIWLCLAGVGFYGESEMRVAQPFHQATLFNRDSKSALMVLMNSGSINQRTVQDL